MTEPLLFGTTLLAIALVCGVDRRGAPAAPHARRPGARRGLPDSLRSLADHGGAVSCSPAVAMLRRGAPVRRCAARLRPAGGLPCDRDRPVPGATAGGRLERWFVTTGFFVAENEALGHAAGRVGAGAERRRTSSPDRPLVWPAYAAAVAARAAAFVRSQARAPCRWCSRSPPRRAALVRVLQGHPFRIRYGVPLFRRVRALRRRDRPAAARLQPLPPRCSSPASRTHQSPLDRSAPMVAKRSATPPIAPAVTP